MKNLCAYNGLAMVALLLPWVLLPLAKDRMALVRLPKASVSPEWPLVKGQQKRPVFIGQFGVMAQSATRGRKSPAISRNPLGAGAVVRRNRLQSDQT